MKPIQQLKRGGPFLIPNTQFAQRVTFLVNGVGKKTVFFGVFCSNSQNASCQTNIICGTTQMLFRSAHVNILVGRAIFPFRMTIKMGGVVVIQHSTGTKRNVIC